MLTRTEKATGDTTTYTYNVEDQLVRVSFPEGGFVSYRYDGLGRRIEKNHNGNITQYYYDNEDILLEYIYQPSTNDYQLSSRYTHGPGIDEPLIMDRDGETYYYHSDGLGSITTVTDSAQETINSYTYDSFGSIIESSGSLANPYTYTARELDPETGLYYYRARYYDPCAGRFTQVDTVVPNPFNPQSLNGYSYCGNNPVNYTDPLGLLTLPFPNPIGGTGVGGGIRRPIGPGDLPPGILNAPLPPGWTPEWKPGTKPGDWIDPQGNYWHWHPRDAHHEPHWDFVSADGKYQARVYPDGRVEIKKGRPRPGKPGYGMV